MAMPPRPARRATVAPAGSPADDLFPGDVLELGDGFVLCHPEPGDGRLLRLERGAMLVIRPGSPGDTPLYTARRVLWSRWELLRGVWVGR